MSNDKKIKNIAVISGFYYPDMGATSAVTDKFLQALKHKYCFHVITVSWYVNIQPLNDSNINVYYITSFWHRLRAKVETKFRNSNTLLNRFLITLFRIRTFILWNLLYPSATKWEINKYYQKLDQLSKSIDFDAVISVSGMITNQFAARKYKRRNPTTKWVTFILDPFTKDEGLNPPFCIKKLRYQRNLQNEMDIYKTADYNYVLEGLYDILINEFNQPQYKTICMHFVLEDIIGRNKTCDRLNYKNDKDVRLIYAGRLYRVIRNPEYMLSLFSQLDYITLDMYVFQHECDDIIQKYLSEKISLYGVADRKRYEQMICNEYDILVNIGNNSHIYAPSKIFELLSTGRPIVNFYYYKDTQYNVIERYPLGINIGKDDKDALHKLDVFCKSMKGKQLDFSEVEKIFPEYSLKDQVLLLEKLINE